MKGSDEQGSAVEGTDVVSLTKEYIKSGLTKEEALEAAKDVKRLALEEKRLEAAEEVKRLNASLEEKKLYVAREMKRLDLEEKRLDAEMKRLDAALEMKRLALEEKKLDAGLSVKCESLHSTCLLPLHSSC